MKAVLKILAIGGLLAAVAWPQADSAGLEKVLSQMDAASRNFTTAEASFVWDHYYAVLKEVDESASQKGKIYFQREGGDVRMAADIAAPDKEYLLYGNGKLQRYNPKADQVEEYNPGKNRSEVESYLVLGFGGGGHDLLKSYSVKFLGPDTANGVKAEKLELVPKSDRLRSSYIASILLWIDPDTGLSVQQQFFEPDAKGGSNGDYRLAKYSDIKIHQKLPDEVFKLKTTKKTKFIPQG